MSLQEKSKRQGVYQDLWHFPTCCSVALLLLWADRTFSLLVPKCENSPGHWLPVLYQICLNITVSRWFLITKHFKKVMIDSSTPTLRFSERWARERDTIDTGPSIRGQWHGARSLQLKRKLQESRAPPSPVQLLHGFGHYLSNRKSHCEHFLQICIS